MNANEKNYLTTDLIIIGGGAAGMRAAIAAAKENINIFLLTKGQAAHSGATPMACPSYQAAFAMEDDRDNPEIAFEDTCFEGRYLGDENLIHALVNEATDRAMDLEKYGVKFRKNDEGKYIQVVHPGHSFERNLVIVGNGYAMAAGLLREVKKHKNITIMDDQVVTRILKRNDSVCGVISLDMRQGKPIVIKTKAIILATGGYQELWRWTDTEPGLTGEGVFLAYEVGANLVDMEMMLFYPAGLCYPDEVAGTLVQYEGLMTPKYCAGEMLNGKNEKFLPQTERLPVRDIMMKFMFKEIEEGRGTPHGGVYIDLSKSPKSGSEIKEILKRLDSLPYNQLTDLGIDVLSEPIEVKPVTHYTLGGVRINEWGETNVKGLYAAGEVSGNVHGANRTSGNALAETQVFGRRAGIRAAEYAREIKLRDPVIDEVNKELERINSFLDEKEQPVRPIEIKRKIKGIMQDYVSYRRNEKGLFKAIELLRKLRNEDVPNLQVVNKNLVYNYEWEEAIEAVFMIEVSELVAVSALFRKESRGHHWREDFPNMDQNWEKHTLIQKDESKPYLVNECPVVRLKDRTKERRQADPALLEAGVLQGYKGV
jgi:succinate dehydrogenase/fumarate reductase flavoprotein subunit